MDDFGTGDFEIAYLVTGASSERKQRHVAILTADHLAERIVGAVVGA